MVFTEADLDNLSTLARITITPNEKGKMLADMQAILGYISEINEVEGSLAKEDVVMCNIIREDVVTHVAGSNTQLLLDEAPATENGYVKVMQVLK